MLPQILFISGKGGVGKTTLSQAIVGALRPQRPSPQEIELIRWPARETDPQYEKATIEYIGLKLRSPWIGRWIYHTPFFNALLKMLPGLSYLVMLGRIIYEAKKHPQTSYIIDGPSSGHLLSILQAPVNFSQMFITGPLFQDLLMMRQTIEDPALFALLHVELPTALSYQEALETNLLLHELYPKLNILSALNQSLKARNDVDHDIITHSAYLHHRYQQEMSLPPKSYDISIPLSFGKDYNEKINELAPHLSPLGHHLWNQPRS